MRGLSISPPSAGSASRPEVRGLSEGPREHLCPTQRRRRLLAIALVVLIHLVVLALLNMMPRAPPLPETPTIFVSLHGGAPTAVLGRSSPNPSDAPVPVEQPPAEATAEPRAIDPAAEVPPEPALTLQAAAAQLAALGPLMEAAPYPSASAAYSATSVAMGGNGKECRLQAVLQTGLARDPAILAALSRIPRSSRSVANAIMLWNGSWIDARPLGGEAAVEPIRRAIQNGVRTAPTACLDETVSGPVLILVMSQPDTTILALGSGRWRWADLLRDPDPQSPQRLGFTRP